MRDLIEDVLEYLYTNSGSIYLFISAFLVLYGVIIQVWLIVCISIASFVFAIATFIRKERKINRINNISKKLDVLTLEQKKEILERELPSIPVQE